MADAISNQTPATDQNDSDISVNPTKWTEVNRKRTRESPVNGSKAKRQTLIQDYWLSNPIKTTNSFQPLQNQSENIDVSNPEKKDDPIKILKSPPIFINGVDNIRPLIELLNKIAENKYTIKILSNNEVKIIPHSPEKYVPIVEELKKKNTQFYTYQMKQNKPYKCVLRNIHPSVDPKDIKIEIENLGHKVVRISNI